MRDMAIGDLMVALYKQGLDTRVSRLQAAGPREAPAFRAIKGATVLA